MIEESKVALYLFACLEELRVGRCMKSRTFDMEKKKVSIGRVIRHLEDIAPPVYQAGYDNTGLQVGDPSLWVKGILIALDATEEVVAEAIGRGCNLLITHPSTHLSST